MILPTIMAAMAAGLFIPRTVLEYLAQFRVMHELNQLEDMTNRLLWERAGKISSRTTESQRTVFRRLKNEAV